MTFVVCLMNITFISLNYFHVLSTFDYCMSHLHFPRHGHSGYIVCCLVACSGMYCNSVAWYLWSQYRDKQ